MRIWSLHPKYLDKVGLSRAINESILGYKSLHGRTKGYKKHSQLIRWRGKEEHLQNYIAYLLDYKLCLQHKEIDFPLEDWDVTEMPKYHSLTVTNEQIEYEFYHLQKKLLKRSPEKYKQNILDISDNNGKIESHPVFEIIPGKIECWEKIKSN